MAYPASWWLLYVVLPLWIFAGHLDWWCHKLSKIELTSGSRESIFHLTMFFQMGTGLLLAVFFQVNYLLISLLLFLFCIHEATTWIELRWVEGKRPISPLEQLVHSFLEILPFTALLVLTLEATTIAKEMQWQLIARTELDLAHVASAGIAVLMLNVIPLLEEASRCYRALRV